MAGLMINVKKQLALLLELSTSFKNEYVKFPLYKTENSHVFFLNNGGFESVDAEIYYCLIRRLKPKLIYEIGSGSSTILAVNALVLNREEGYGGRIVSIDPYP